ncbi:hypothetical protein [Paraburkholderia caledonica]|uniref:Transposase n=1 Tax=Paraburkholderia caledonica TaxID=134536 RepID=A0ABU1L6E9_9BURK|nr:hypothetical protein [Paraburkholderia caledonica]MDR6378799.1 hypothetical protein [Paraburkholderia caledonica]
MALTTESDQGKIRDHRSLANVKAWNAAEQLYDLQFELLSPSSLKETQSIPKH